MPAGSKPGERRGGRQKGAKNKKVIEREQMIAAAQAEAAGLPRKKTALEVIEEAMLFAYGLAATEQRKGEAGSPSKLMGYLEKAADFGKMLAPYRHARLSHVTVKDDDFDITRLTDAELATLRRLRQLASANQSGADRSGGATTRH